VKFKIVYVVGK